MISAITTVFVYILFGFLSPLVFLDANFFSDLENFSLKKNLYSQAAIAQLPSPSNRLPLPNVSNSLQNVNPMQSLGNVTGPLDSIWQAIGAKLNINSANDIKALINPSQPAANNTTPPALSNASIDHQGQFWALAKAGVILAGNILVVVLELILSIVKSVLSMINSGTAAISKVLIE